jgi:hypothetical protein
MGRGERKIKKRKTSIRTFFFRRRNISRINIKSFFKDSNG